MALKHLNPFRKKGKNAKTMRPDDYYQATRVGIWVSADTNKFLKDFAAQKNRSISVMVDDIVSSMWDELPSWIESASRQTYLKEKNFDAGIRLVNVTEEALGKIESYAGALEITRGQALDEIVMCQVVQIVGDRRQEKTGKRVKPGRYYSAVVTDLPAQMYRKAMDEVIPRQSDRMPGAKPDGEERRD